MAHGDSGSAATPAGQVPAAGPSSRLALRQGGVQATVPNDTKACMLCSHSSHSVAKR